MKTSRSLTRPTVLLWAFRVLAATAVSFPAARVITRAGPSTFPDGDLLLFAPGAEMLLESLRLGGREVGAALQGASFTLLLFSLMGLLPLAMAITALAVPSAATADLFRRGATSLPPLLGLDGVHLLAQATLATLTAVATGALAVPAEAFTDERVADLARVSVVAIGVLVALGLGFVHDFARVFVVRDGAALTKAVQSAFGALALHGARALSRFLSLALVAALLVLGAARATSFIDVSRAGASRVAAVFVLHQAVVFVLAALRVCFLATAVDLCEPRAAHAALARAARLT